MKKIGHVAEGTVNMISVHAMGSGPRVVLADDSGTPLSVLSFAEAHRLGGLMYQAAEPPPDPERMREVVSDRDVSEMACRFGIAEIAAALLSRVDTVAFPMKLRPDVRAALEELAAYGGAASVLAVPPAE